MPEASTGAALRASTTSHRGFAGRVLARRARRSPQRPVAAPLGWRLAHELGQSGGGFVDARNTVDSFARKPTIAPPVDQEHGRHDLGDPPGGVWIIFEVRKRVQLSNLADLELRRRL